MKFQFNFFKYKHSPRMAVMLDAFPTAQRVEYDKGWLHVYDASGKKLFSISGG